MSERVVLIEKLEKRFGDLQVLKGIDLAVNQGDVLAIIGPSGSGKTTLLRCINFLQPYDRGRVYIDGELHELALLPTGYQGRRHELTWKYNLENSEHQVRVVWKNPTGGYRIDLGDVLVYGPVPGQ